jgi:alpha-glucuronidase
VGLGFDRSPTGSDAVSQYFPPLPERYGRLESVPEKFLLFFHHVPWDYRLRSGRSLWEELVRHYDAGVAYVDAMQATWRSLAGRIDPERHDETRTFLAIQGREARWWRDACVLYFQTFSKQKLPEGSPAAMHSLDYYMAIRSHYVPGHR